MEFTTVTVSLAHRDGVFFKKTKMKCSCHYIFKNLKSLIYTFPGLASYADSSVNDLLAYERLAGHGYTVVC